MREQAGELFAYQADAVVIPVNWTTKRNGDAVMGAGVARQAALRCPWLPTRLGYIVGGEGKPSVRAFPTDDFWVVAFPTKRDWRKPSDLALIEGMLASLLRLAEWYRWQTVALPRLGCGLGGLDWSDVQLVLARYLDDRFVVVHRGATPDAGEGM